MPVVEIRDLDHPRLDPYRNLSTANLTRWSGRFVAEGHRVVRRLLESSLSIESVLVSERRRGLLDDVIRADVDLLVVPQSLGAALVGFNFHAGVMACAARPAVRRVEELLPVPLREATFVVCPRMTDPDNLGGLFRLSAAFGVAGLVIGPSCADPYSRRVVRVSMGHAFRVPLAESVDLERDLQQIREAGVTLVAAVVDPAAEPLTSFRRTGSLALLLGNEADGLEPRWVALSQRQLVIPMAAGVDSLNVTVAAGIILHAVTSTRPGDRGFEPGEPPG